jgi:hypothetical protein
LEKERKDFQKKRKELREESKRKGGDAFQNINRKTERKLALKRKRRKAERWKYNLFHVKKISVHPTHPLPPPTLRARSQWNLDKNGRNSANSSFLKVYFPKE